MTPDTIDIQEWNHSSQLEIELWFCQSFYAALLIKPMDSAQWQVAPIVRVSRRLVDNVNYIELTSERKYEPPLVAEILKRGLAVLNQKEYMFNQNLQMKSEPIDAQCTDHIECIITKGSTARTDETVEWIYPNKLKQYSVWI